MRFTAALLIACAAAGCAEDAPTAAEKADAPARAPAPVPAPAPAPAPEPAPPGAATIPAVFRSVWAESEALCADRAHWSRLTISAGTLDFYESVMTVARVERPTPRSFVAYGTATGEGTTRPAEHEFILNEAGDTLTDGGGGGTVRVRCG